jgi:hypothetical protein
MKLTLWMVPAAGVAAVAAMASLAFLPIERAVSPPPIEASAPAPPPAPPVVQAAAPPSAPPPPAPAPVDPDADLYQREVRYLSELHKINLDGAREAMALGGTTQSSRMINDAKQQASLITCLENQQQRGVPFYEAKATCNAAG